MYPFAYLLLVIGTTFYFGAKNDKDNELVYDIISICVLPFNYLVMWTIELLLCFEMQLIQVKINANGPAEC